MRVLPFPGQSPYQRDLTLWEPQGSPKAVVLISHGMAEHIARYNWVGEALAKDSFLCAGYNHLGHSAQAPLLGWFSENDGWGKVVTDLHTVMDYLSALAPGKPRVLLGHSMGSFLAREYILRYPNGADLLVLSGSGWHPRALCVLGQSLAKVPLALGKGRRTSKFLDKLAFSANNKPFRGPGVSIYTWLTRDENKVREYEADPYCGFVFTASGFHDLFGGLKALTRLDRLSLIPKDLPVYFMSGLSDPVGGMGEGVKTLAGQYRDAGLKDITLALYEGARHELFNETNRQEAFLDLLTWLNHRLSQEVTT